MMTSVISATSALWSLGPNRVLTADGECEFSRSNRTLVYVRFRGRFVFISCESTINQGDAGVVIYISEALEWVDVNGTQPVSATEKSEIQNFIMRAAEFWDGTIRLG